MRTRLLKCKVVNAAVDWITCSAATPDAQKELWNQGRRLLYQAEFEGEQPTRWHAHGYEGWQARSIALGARPDGTSLRLSGSQASYEWKHAVCAAENVSRLDLAVDCQTDPPVTSLSRDIYRDARHVTPVNGRPPSRSLIVNGNGGSTAYIGARASEQFGRVYDKGVQSNSAPPGTWWRWELELKGRAAWSVASQLNRIDDPGVMICATVASWFHKRTLHTYTTSLGSGTLVGSRNPTALEQKLLWLARGVRPTVQFLVERVGLERVLFALGLPPQSAVERAYSDDAA
jgi:hypothetical protein